MRYNHRLHRHNQIHRPRHHRRQRLTSLLITLAVILVLAALTRFRGINSHTFYIGFSVSFARVIIAYILAALLAIVLALVSTRNAAFEAILLPILDVAQSFPSLALIPLLISFFGRNSLVVVGVLIVVMVWPIAFSLIGQIKTGRQDLRDAAKLYGAQGFQKLRYVTLPMLLPALMTGSIVAWGQAWDSMVGAEIISTVRGVGTYLGDISAANQPLVLFLAITIYLLLIFVLNEAIWLPLLRVSARYQSDS